MMNGENKTVCVITGATSGIGLETARALVVQGTHLVLVGRNPEKTLRVREELSAVAGADSVDSCLADLQELAQVRALADALKERYPRIDILVNNAGAIFSEHARTVDGFERTWALNHLNYFLLTNLLLDCLKASPAGRIINLASDAHRRGKIHWDDIHFEHTSRAAGWGPYCQSKLANILFTRELARRLGGTSVTTCAIHPGFVNTGFARNNGTLGKAFMTFTRLFQRSVGHGAETVIWAATSAEARELHGSYLVDCAERRPTALARHDPSARRLWSLSEAMTDSDFS